MARRISKARRERMADALKLREGGATYHQIADQLGISYAQAYADVQDALKEITREAAEDVLEIELMRLDNLFRMAYVKARKGNLKAIDTALKVMDRRARLLGLDKPEGANGAQLDSMREAYSQMFLLGVDAGAGNLDWAETTPLDDPAPEPEHEGD